ncbi:uncharacterized protein ACA1_259500 [Acanthamoeba castellanii str. Neff]|jgi:uncharacterized membrane protein YphA (DoxX/SURF4 family)|uniref:DoxX subfamily protein n=1 Tax=Acanthamoeba castellanii (strain ATCC 30010 / Neff) TaxID=1257118 RepID=L8GHI1_ACACF|nr:uncharacterized protein ACA1_259500 [Acanthamoeba castellanii str. Neff]ELR11626.1 hypothetical protein ACA1_259500 [Acanthamoeba castellanii str. Neff]
MSQVLRAIGTLLLVAVFLPSLIHHAASAEAMIPQTEAALSRLLGHTVGREMAEVIYWASSALLLGGPLLVLGVFLPVLRKLGALLLFVFLAGVTPTMHDFWAKTEQGEQQAHMVHFLKNLSLMGALLLILAEPAATPARTGGSASRTTARKQQKKLH